MKPQNPTRTKPFKNWFSVSPTACLTATMLAIASYADALTIRVEGKGVDIRHFNSGDINKYTLFPNGKKDTFTSYLADPSIITSLSPELIGKDYAVIPWAGGSSLIDETRTDYSMGRMIQDEPGKIYIMLDTATASISGWSRDPATLTTKSGKKYFGYVRNYPTANTWVTIPKTPTVNGAPTIVLSERGNLLFANPRSFGVHAEGVIIYKDTDPYNTGSVTDPSLLVMPNGDYIAGFGGSEGGRYRSTNKGASWTRISGNAGIGHPSTFTLGGAVYIVGDGGIARSTNGGVSYSSPVYFNGDVRTSPSQVEVGRGRVWMACESYTTHKVNLLSAPVTSDLMNPSSWSLTVRQDSDPNFVPVDIEPTMLIDRDGWAIAMPEQGPPIKASSPTKAATMFPPSEFKLPGSESKYSTMYDPATGRYWALTSYSPIAGNIRTGITLFSSTNLKTWTNEKLVIQGQSINFDGFNYPFMQFDGNDIVFVLRSAYETEKGQPERWHDGNLFTFHRIRNFRSLAPAPTTAVVTSGKTYNIIAKHSQKALNVAGDSRVDGGDAVQWGDGNTNNSRWKITSTSGGFFKVEGKNSLKALAVSGDSTADAADVIQWTYGTGPASRQWQFVRSSDGYYKVLNRLSGKALNVDGASTADDANVIQYGDGGGTNSQWRLVESP
jgi:hypothetical protein